MTPNEHPDLFSTIVLGTAVSPGVVTISGHDREEKWDVEEAKGQEGASSTHVGSGVGQFQASFFLATAAEQIAWPAFQRVIESTTNGPEPKALPIYHPDLAANRFTEVCKANVGGAVRDQRGGVTFLVKFIEYKPPRPKTATTAKGGGGSAATPKNARDGEPEPYDPNAERKRELEKKLNEAKNS